MNAFAPSTCAFLSKATIAAETSVETNCISYQSVHWQEFCENVPGARVFDESFIIMSSGSAIFTGWVSDVTGLTDELVVDISSSSRFKDQVDELFATTPAKKVYALTFQMTLEEDGSLKKGHTNAIVVNKGGKLELFDNYYTRPALQPVVERIKSLIDQGKEKFHRNIHNKFGKTKDNKLCFLNSMFFIYKEVTARKPLSVMN